MIETIEIRRNICIDHKNLDSNYKKHLLEKINILTKDECSKNFGHIVEVIDIVKIIDNKISSAKANIIFDIIFKAKVLKPIKNKCYDANVCMITEDGIFLDVLDKINILIPKNELSEYEINDDKYIHKNTKKNIKYGDIINVCIRDTKYSNKNFSSIGFII
jgi:DNA-directed RNA polymerase subunit E'/Rpb7